MTRSSNYVHWTVIALIVVLGVMLWSAGQRRNAGGDYAATCATPREAIAAAEKFDAKLGRSSERTGQIFHEKPDKFEVTLIFEGMQTAHYSVARDCSVKFA